ncbi:MAG: transposase [Thermodesulfobacteriota bacterium]
MPSVRIPRDAASGFYFLTFTVRNWYYIFDRHNRFDMLGDALRYCKENKGLKLYAYVFMLNHVHLVVSSRDTIGFVRDFKRHTSKELLRNMAAIEPDVLKLFEVEGGRYEFWARTNMPKAIESERFLLQKVEYVHNNPVRKRYVERPEYWLWSSANPESEVPVNPLPA